MHQLTVAASRAATTLERSMLVGLDQEQQRVLHHHLSSCIEALTDDR